MRTPREVCFLIVQLYDAGELLKNIATDTGISSHDRQTRRCGAQETEMNNRVFTYAEWDKLLSEANEAIISLSKLKGGEYAGDEDRLANFRRNAENLGLRMEQIWAVYAGKHWDAVMQYIKDLGTGKVRERMEPIEGRVDDLLVYLLLFKAMLQETAHLVKHTHIQPR